MAEHEDGMERFREWLDAVSELVDAARATGRSAHSDDCPDRLCAALRRYDAANDARSNANG